MESLITVSSNNLERIVNCALCFTKKPNDKDAAAYAKVIYLVRKGRKLRVFATDRGAGVWFAIPASVLSGEDFCAVIEARQAQKFAEVLRRMQGVVTLIADNNNLIASNDQGNEVWKNKPVEEEILFPCLHAMNTVSTSITSKAHLQAVAQVNWDTLRKVACLFDKYDNPFLILRSDIRDGFTVALWTTEKRLTDPVVVGQGEVVTFIPINPQYACGFNVSGTVKVYRDVTTDFEIWRFRTKNAIMKAAQMFPNAIPAWQRWGVSEISLTRVTYVRETRHDVPTAEFLSREQVERLNRRLQEVFPQVTSKFMRRWGKYLNCKRPDGAHLIVDRGQIFIVYEGKDRDRYPVSLSVDLRAAITPLLKEMVYEKLYQEYGHPCIL